MCWVIYWLNIVCVCQVPHQTRGHCIHDICQKQENSHRQTWNFGVNNCFKHQDCWSGPALAKYKLKVHSWNWKHEVRLLEVGHQAKGNVHCCLHSTYYRNSHIWLVSSFRTLESIRLVLFLLLGSPSVLEKADDCSRNDIGYHTTEEGAYCSHVWEKFVLIWVHFKVTHHEETDYSCFPKPKASPNQY